MLILHCMTCVLSGCGSLNTSFDFCVRVLGFPFAFFSFRNAFNSLKIPCLGVRTLESVYCSYRVMFYLNNV